MHRLPAQIAAVMIGTILLFVVTLGTAMLWMSRALDDHARDQSVSQIRDARDNLLDHVRLTAIDYAKWEAAVEEAEARNLAWLYENIGTSATIGQVLHLAVVFGGDYPQDLGWTDDGVEEGRPGLLDPATLDQVERRLAALPVGAYEATQFFAWRAGSVFALGAARLEVIEEGAAPSPASATDDAEIERLLLGRRVTPDSLAGIADSFRLTGLELVRQPPADRPSVPLSGADGDPIAHLAWDAPNPGTAELRRMRMPLLLVLAFTTALAVFGMVLVGRDARQLVAAKRDATAAALTDPLTGLPNRAAFTAALAPSAPAGERAVLFLDVNGFKRINDSLGHAVGDGVIRILARRLESLLSPGSLLARIGGDEFVYVVTGPDAEIRTEWLAHAAQRALASPVAVAEHRLQVRAAMGHAVQTTDSMSGEELVRQADLAMYEAKRRRDQGPVAFSAVIDRAGREARALEQALRGALHRTGELWIAYQPVVSADGSRLVRAEALARWTSPELGSVPPDSFIPVAERAGLIGEFGRRLLHLVCNDLAAHPGLSVSVDISPLQLIAPDFVPDLLGLLGRRGIDPSRLQVEFTENVLVDDPALVAQRIRELQEGGISTALDDFGTGFSSIGTLRQMKFDVLKIDRSFVSGLDAAPERRELVNAMILLAHALDLRVVCEGVETEDELAALRDLGCDLLQGFGIERPLPLDDFARRWLAETDRAIA